MSKGTYADVLMGGMQGPMPSQPGFQQEGLTEGITFCQNPNCWHAMVGKAWVPHNLEYLQTHCMYCQHPFDHESARTQPAPAWQQVHVGYFRAPDPHWEAPGGYGKGHGMPGYGPG